ncbi:hypothetical protein AM2_174 [Lactococcus phage AM2]|uniref:Uncharacterized protein n=9 Tax=Audreyjarvisvirus TaxID=2843351 RepID=A0A1W6JLT7_9CAUD|nr:DNA binding protein [Lactococcus phage AM1]YP_009905516.1 DNA binding protein [Lactococcus phage AM4]ARM66479.1 hypothetical protein AM2_174 [Lactococcus phage AM2]ARM66656.1 hypothetical protein AM3_174 [Lactococcus phage AM3]ARM67032.1 hypothetical protein AM5_179 [Lactococcus phage AM5]ARM67210.1 hypothetical protein AM8_175 [Lactococcus phage AM8]ARM67389.1 hypothetical protein AM9_176 [Lactococcus phage AM9]ARM67567.1 hypothetical protein AM11_175 [Lactococcus phage AM11]ARQ95755.1 
MSKKDYYRTLSQEVWEDDKLRELGITQKDVKAVISAFERHMSTKLRETGEFRWKNVMVLKTKLIKGFSFYDVTARESKVFDDYYRIQYKPADKFKRNVKQRKEDLELIAEIEKFEDEYGHKD